MTKRVLGIGLILCLFIPLAEVPAQALQIQYGFETYAGSGFSAATKAIVEAAIAASNLYVTLSDATAGKATFKFLNTNSQFSITGIYIDVGANRLFSGWTTQTGSGLGTVTTKAPGVTFPSTVPLTPAFTTDYSLTISGNGIDKSGEYVSALLTYKSHTPAYTLDNVVAQLVSGDLRIGVKLTMASGGASGTLLLDPPVPNPPGSPVPEPGTLLLVGSGLVGLAGLGRKKLRLEYSLTP